MIPSAHKLLKFILNSIQEYNYRRIIIIIIQNVHELNQRRINEVDVVMTHDCDAITCAAAKMADELFVNVFGSGRRTELKAEVNLSSMSVHDLKECVYKAVDVSKNEHGKHFITNCGTGSLARKSTRVDPYSIQNRV